jgi:hypothetical protein
LFGRSLETIGSKFGYEINEKGNAQEEDFSALQPLNNTKISVSFEDLLV